MKPPSFSPLARAAVGLLATACGVDSHLLIIPHQADYIQPAASVAEGGAPVADCYGRVQDGGSQQRVRYAKGLVGPNEECQPELQSRACDGGTWGAWSGDFQAPSCFRRAFGGCDDFASGQTEYRLGFQTTQVAFGEQCVPQRHSRTCYDGDWSSWSGPLACSPREPITCLGVPHGSVETRTLYLVERATPEDGCQSEEQTRTCENGVWTDFTGSFETGRCVVWCDGRVEHRNRYLTPQVEPGESCADQLEAQTRTCVESEWGTWAGTTTTYDVCEEPEPPTGL